uniref:Uncharacterized protein TCIL3000_10_10950 n=1 Tax=Trypanosoma congolense (strain IL3000) TaxID=1068625 RepID=G0UY49_TRYCI|nr:unnamed protein product [Trypanosoma congolense IL3000]
MPLETVNFTGKPSPDGETFTPTAEELRTIRKKMDDPKFLELFQEYMNSMEDPETRREEEAYLRQVEQEARMGGDYSFDFVFPRAGFAVELLEPNPTYQVKVKPLPTGNGKAKVKTRVFVNICSSEKIDPFREETTGDKNSSNWFVPVSISKPRTEFFSETHGSVVQNNEKNGGDGCQETVLVYDAVFHPKTLQLADQSDRFCCFLVNIAVEHINAGYGDNHGFQFRRLSSSVTSVGTLQSQTIKREGGKSPFEPTANEPVLTKPTRKLPESTSTSGRAQPLGNTQDRGNASEGDTQGILKSKKGVSSSPAVSQDKPTSAGVCAKEKMPPSTVTHRGHIDLSYMGWKVVDRRIGVPEELAVKMVFAGVQSASVLNIEVEDAYIKVSHSKDHPYHGTLPLPFTVERTPLEARFERKSSTLTLVLKVVPPSPTGITAADMRQQLMEGSTEDSPAEKVVCTEQNADTAPEDKRTVDGAENFTTEGHLTERTGRDTDAVESGTAHEVKQQECLSTPQFSTMSDQDRVRQVMEKVQAARLERERAEQSEATGVLNEEKNKFKSETSAPVEGDCTSRTEKPTYDNANDHHNLAGSSAITSAPTNTFCGEETLANPPQEENEELLSLKQRQDAWREDLEKRLSAAEDEERQAAIRAEREAQREAERLKKRAAAAKLQEEAEVKLRKSMEELPLSNKHIYAID